MIGQQAGEFATAARSHCGLKAILANAVLHDFEPGVVAALPVNGETQSIALDRDDDLLKTVRKIRLRISVEDGDGSTPGASHPSANSICRSSS